MQIIVNGKVAVLKKGTSFEFVSENRSFTDADGYSFSISFPLAGCPDNIAIFGHLNRADIDKTQVIFDCEISDTYFYRAGIITITEISNSEVKAQFLEGRSASNYDVTFDDIFINELDLGEPSSLTPPSETETAWQGLIYGQEYISLPWVNNVSGNLQNEVVYVDGTYQWGEDVSNLSFFPYLIVITKRICEALGYEYDFSDWDDSEDKKYIIICNALPGAWDIPQFARALPHWSVTEYFDKLENFLGCEFDINHKTKMISLAFTKILLSSAQTIRIDKVLDSFSSEITADDESNYIEMANLQYKECGHNMWKFYSCPWFVKDNINNRVEYDTLDDLIDKNKSFARVRSFYRSSNIHRVLYAKDVDMNFVVRCIRNEYVETNSLGREIYDHICILQPINVFGSKFDEDESNNTIELDFVPAWIDETEESKGNCLFIDIDSFNEDESTNVIRPSEIDSSDSTIYQPFALQQLINGEKDEKTEYFDKIFVAFWDGTNNNIGNLPCPILDWVTVKEDWTYFVTHYSMRLSHSSLSSIFNIEPKQKYTFSFLMNEIPNVRSIFYINGKKYLCEKITTTFSENGMSELKKGVFYRIID